MPIELGGIPLDEVGATGWGLLHAAQVAVQHCNLALRGARVAIQGFGAVGRHAARFFSGKGAVIVAVSDSRGTLLDPDGIDVAQVARNKEAGGSVCDVPRGEKRDRDAIIDVECDIWIPAARPDVVREDNAHRLRAKLVLQGANIPFTAGAERLLHQRGVLVVPDFIANAGGVICAALEYRGATQSAAFAAIAEKVSANTEAVLAAAQARGIPPREAAFELAVKRVKKAMSARRFSVF